MFFRVAGVMIMFPIALFSGEVWSAGEDKMGFLDRKDLHTPTYLSLNFLAGECGQSLGVVASMPRYLDAIGE